MRQEHPVIHQDQAESFSQGVDMKDLNIAEGAVCIILTTRDEELCQLNVKYLAESLKVTRSRLSRAFRKDQNMSINAFITREIIYRVMFHLMKFPETQVKELVRRLGFKDDLKFEKKFKRLILVTPSRYGELMKSRDENQSVDENLPGGSLKEKDIHE